MRTLYRILCVEKDATATEIKRAYRAIARDNHPDLANQRGWSRAEIKKRAQVFKDASTANEILTNKAKRASYDRDLDALRWSFLAQRRGRERPRQSAKPDLDPQPFDGINVEDVAAAVQTQAQHRRQLRIEAGREQYKGRQAAFREAVEKLTEEMLAEVLLGTMDDLGL